MVLLIFFLNCLNLSFFILFFVFSDVCFYLKLFSAFFYCFCSVVFLLFSLFFLFVVISCFFYLFLFFLFIFIYFYLFLFFLFIIIYYYLFLFFYFPAGFWSCPLGYIFDSIIIYRAVLAIVFVSCYSLHPLQSVRWINFDHILT